MRRVLVLVAAGYLGVLLVLLALENAMLYHPAGPANWNQPSDLAVHDIALQTTDATPIHAWWCPHEGAGEVLLYCHGNAGNLSWRARQIQELQRELGVSVLIFDYPGYGRSGGAPSEAGCYAAADAAYDWLTATRGVPPERLVLYGKSLGGGVATDLAARRPHRALVLVKTYTSIPAVGQGLFPWLPVRWLMRNRFDNLAKIVQVRRPVFIASGDCDRLTPCTHGAELYAAANEPKEFLKMAGVDHNTPCGPDFFVGLRRFLQEAEAPAGVARAPMD